MNLDNTQKMILINILKDLKEDAELLNGLEGEAIENFVAKEILKFYKENV